MSKLVSPPPSILPLWYRGRVLEGTEVQVDHNLFPLLSSFRWILSDMRTKRPPRTLLEKGPSVFVSILLNRMVVGLSSGVLTLPAPSLSSFESVSEIVNSLRDLPRVRFLNGDPFDCRRENLSSSRSDRSILERPPLPLRLPPSTALYTTPKADLLDIETSPVSLSVPESPEPSALSLLGLPSEQEKRKDPLK